MPAMEDFTYYTLLGIRTELTSARDRVKTLEGLEATYTQAATPSTVATAPMVVAEPVRRRRVMSAEARAKISAAAKKRWAAKARTK
jgi:hypothetical protein